LLFTRYPEEDMDTWKLVFWAAARIMRHLARDAPEADGEVAQWVRYLSERHEQMATAWRRIELARGRGWQLAASRLHDDIFFEARRIESSCGELLRLQSEPRGRGEKVPSLRPSLRTIVDELRQLGQEFEEVDVLPRRNVIVARTRPVILDGIRLGPFAIELHLGRLNRRADSSCFDCVALQPNPAECDEDVVHPHVKGAALCAGDAHVPICEALQQGRICDAFLLVNGVLNTYNDGSPYVDLDAWSGRSCSDCGALTSQDDMYVCDGCDSDVCDDCVGRCELCDSTRCRSCLELDEVSGRSCCSHCHERCEECNRVVDKDSVDSATGLCLGCFADRRQQEAEEEAEQDEAEPALQHEKEELTDEPVEQSTLASQASSAR
jgi:hypothetical protein